MTLQFYLRYKTKYGEEVFLISSELTEIAGTDSISMHFENEDYWSVTIELPENFKKDIQYYYLVQNLEGYKIYDGERSRIISVKDLNTKVRACRITDTWIGTDNPKNILYLAPFASGHPKNQKRTGKAFTHEFKVKAPMLQHHETVCLLGSTIHLGQWESKKPILMKYCNGWYIAQVTMNENEWPVSYKYAVYNTRSRDITNWETGENRRLEEWNTQSGQSVINDGYLRIATPAIRQAGINIPVFSLRSKKGFGVGEFSDIKTLADWCTHAGLRVIQLLPVNDTTVSGNWQDSYPYAPVSAFALHPLYINLDLVAGKTNAALVKKLNTKKNQLNKLPAVDYEQVMKFKISMLRELFAIQKKNLKTDRKFAKFIRDNKEWLQPYAAFCYLREKNKTSDFTAWKDYNVYKEASVKRLVGSTRKEHNDILFYYFVQFHLHLQLKESADYAHKKGIALKGDLPIGLHRNSCDVWMHPELFDVTMQAGAPPDVFTEKGQNWGFPIYNWEEMKKDNYLWWQKRLQHLSLYFDAYRVDHILGFFRIWSIPVEQKEGLLGRFIPANPVYFAEFQQDRIYFDYDRFCQPYISDEILEATFGQKSSFVKDNFLKEKEDGTYRFKEELNTQVRAEKYLSENELTEYKDGIFQLLTNIILMEEKGSGKQKFHFRYRIEDTSSFKALDGYLQDQLKWLSFNYFHTRQDKLWSQNAMEKLPVLQRSTNMLMCAEDLGWVPASVPSVMHYLDIPGLKSERITPDMNSEFFNLQRSPYLSIAQPGTHDMKTLREWWEENPRKTQRYYNQLLQQEGKAPGKLTPELARQVIGQYLNAPTFWSIFLLQDLLSVSEKGRTEKPEDERINIPAEAKYYWRYRMELNLEDLIKNKKLTGSVHHLLEKSDRL